MLIPASRRPPSGGRSPPNFGIALIVVSLSCLGIGFYYGLSSSEKQAAAAASALPSSGVPKAVSLPSAPRTAAAGTHKQEGSVSGSIKGGSLSTKPKPICTNTCAKVRC